VRGWKRRKKIQKKNAKNDTKKNLKKMEEKKVSTVIVEVPSQIYSNDDETSSGSRSYSISEDGSAHPKRI